LIVGKVTPKKGAFMPESSVPSSLPDYTFHPQAEDIDNFAKAAEALLKNDKYKNKHILLRDSDNHFHTLKLDPNGEPTLERINKINAERRQRRYITKQTINAKINEMQLTKLTQQTEPYKTLLQKIFPQKESSQVAAPKKQNYPKLSDRSNPYVFVLSDDGYRRNVEIDAAIKLLNTTGQHIIVKASEAEYYRLKKNGETERVYDINIGDIINKRLILANTLKAQIEQAQKDPQADQDKAKGT
jgi:hypothetical protein